MYKFEFTEEEVNKILFSLAKEPYIEVVDIINKIHEQANEQDNEVNAE